MASLAAVLDAAMEIPPCRSARWAALALPENTNPGRPTVPRSRRREDGADPSARTIIEETEPFVGGRVDRRKAPGKVEAEAESHMPDREIVDGIWNYLPPDLAEDADRTRHVPGGGDEHPHLAGFGLHQGLGEPRVVVGVARVALDDDALARDPGSVEERPHPIAFALMRPRQAPAAAG